MPALLLHRQPVAIDPRVHARHGVIPPVDYRFAAGVNSVPLLVPEFPAAAAGYPIVIVRDARRRLMPVALLGLRAGENMMVDADGAWFDHAHVPAFVRRYPFLLGPPSGAKAAPTVSVEASLLVEGQGEALFNADGTRTVYLADATDFLINCQRESVEARAWCARLDAQSLLRAMTVRHPASARRVPGSFLVVDEQRLHGLSDHALALLCRSGDMRAIVLHLTSLRQMPQLFDRSFHSWSACGEYV
jgi:hypothetical protein